MNGWQLAWFIGVYLAVFVCLIAIVRIAIQANSWFEGLKQLLIFVFFVVAEWFLESWGNAKAPFYSYPQTIFPDMVTHMSFPPSVASAAVMAHPCVQDPSPAVSATIPLAGAVIIFCLMWTARLLLSEFWTKSLHPVLVPFMVGVAALFFDLYMDPVLAVSYACDGQTILHGGMGFWEWFTRADLADIWYHVPLYNFAVWYAAPALLAALVILLAGFLQTTTAQDQMLRALIVFALALVVYTSPNAHIPYLQIVAVAGAILLSFYFIMQNWALYKRNNPYRFEFILPLLFFFLYPIVALLFAAAAPLTFGLLAAALFFLVLLLIFVFAPYQNWP